MSFQDPAFKRREYAALRYTDAPKLPGHRTGSDDEAPAHRTFRKLKCTAAPGFSGLPPTRPSRRRAGPFTAPAGVSAWTREAEGPVLRHACGPSRYSTSGTGPVLLCDSGWVPHLRGQLERYSFGAFVGRLAERFTVIRYDKPGCGLSDRDGIDLSFDGQVAAALAVADAERRGACGEHPAQSRECARVPRSRPGVGSSGCGPERLGSSPGVAAGDGRPSRGYGGIAGSSPDSRRRAGGPSVKACHTARSRRASTRGRAPPCRSRSPSTCSCCCCSRFGSPGPAARGLASAAGLVHPRCGGFANEH